MDAVAAFDQHPKRRVEIFPLIGAVESVGEQYDLAAAFGAEGVGIG